METTYDVIVVGGGPAGTGAALAAAENGAHVLLLEGTGRLGGMAVQALVGPFLGGIRSSVVQKILKAMGGRTVDFAQMDVQLYDVLTATGVTILLHAPVVDIIKEEKQVKGVVVHAAGRKLTFTAKAVIDATGNGDVAYMAGVPYESGRDGDHLLQPMSIMYIINGIDPERRFLCGSEEEARRKTVGGRTWEDIVTEAQHNGELPPSVGVVRLYAGSLPSRAIVNATQINGVDGVEPVDLTKAEIDAMMDGFRDLLQTDVTLDLVRHALAVKEEYGIQFYDALIVSAAEKTGCLEIVSEDLNEGQVYRGMKVINPFAEP